MMEKQTRGPSISWKLSVMDIYLCGGGKKTLERDTVTNSTLPDVHKLDLNLTSRGHKHP